MNTFLNNTNKKQRRHLINIYKRVLENDEDAWVAIENFATRIDDYMSGKTTVYLQKRYPTINKLLSLSPIDFILLKSFLTNCLISQVIPQRIIKEWESEVRG